MAKARVTGKIRVAVGLSRVTEITLDETWFDGFDRRSNTRKLKKLLRRAAK